MAIVLLYSAIYTILRWQVLETGEQPIRDEQDFHTMIRTVWHMQHIANQAMIQAGYSASQAVSIVPGVSIIKRWRSIFREEDIILM